MSEVTISICEVCQNNGSFGDRLDALLEDMPEITIERVDCLGLCSYGQRVDLSVDGEVVTQFGYTGNSSLIHAHNDEVDSIRPDIARAYNQIYD